MDKNMINIDELLKQRLGAGEEQERPGAWMNMSKLLDQQMPVNKVPGAAVNWRRMFMYAAGLVLLAAVSVGGYQAIEGFNNSGIAENTSGVGGSTVKGGVATSAINK